MNHNGNGHQTPAPETKTISCPRCSKRPKEKGRGKIGKIIIMISRTRNNGESSGTKERTCPVCRGTVRFSYLFVAGKPKIQVLT